MVLKFFITGPESQAANIFTKKGNWKALLKTIIPMAGYRSRFHIRKAKKTDIKNSGTAMVSCRKKVGTGMVWRKEPG